MCVTCLVCDLPSEYLGGAGAASAREAGSGNRRVSSAHIHPTATPPLNIAGPMFSKSSSRELLGACDVRRKKGRGG